MTTQLIENCVCGKCTPTAPARGKRVTVAAVTAGVNALVEKSTAKPTEPERTVTGMFLTPKAPDGSGGKIVKRVRVGPKVARQFAQPKPHFAEQDAPTPSAVDAATPSAEHDLPRANARLAELDAPI